MLHLEDKNLICFLKNWFIKSSNDPAFLRETQAVGAQIVSDRKHPFFKVFHLIMKKKMELEYHQILQLSKVINLGMEH